MANKKENRHYVNNKEFLAAMTEYREERLAAPGPGQVLVRSLLSAISAGTEMLLFHGQSPDDLPLDENIAALQDKLSYPVKYGYSLVGEVIEIGEGVSSTWQGKRKGRKSFV